MTKHWLRQLKHQNLTKEKKDSDLKERNAFSLEKLMRSLPSKDADFNEVFISEKNSFKSVKELAQILETRKPSKVSNFPKMESPLVVVISHCKRSAKFHETNGFHAISEIPFHDEVEDFTPFSVYTMILDPLNTGRAKELASGLLKDENFNENTFHNVNRCINS